MSWPALYCSFEENELSFQCLYPGKKLINIQVDLLSVRKGEG